MSVGFEDRETEKEKLIDSLGSGVDIIHYSVNVKSLQHYILA